MSIRLLGCVDKIIIYTVCNTYYVTYTDKLTSPDKLRISENNP